ncbi:cytochrome c oxidase assembly protein [Azospirillum picis]|uniref:Membrane protein n=1 Tax=Azospirillum picis TaxID=488438 RepID=A0ABU0MLK8_9PROT|nr:cytochrome c oxidase assembly protein [Azospirillum picis]MBP2301030.1 putative membrane protein [Azospirillum picis]MDQ0534350.1 putative membrane protein [Azospirillum picis]
MPTDALPVVPYCGAPPVPESLWTAWNGDPLLLAALGAGAALAGLVALRPAAGGQATRSHQRWCFAAGWLVLVVVFVSPLCNLTSALFSARVVQHLLTVQLAAPLFVLAWPAGALRLPRCMAPAVRLLARPLAVPELAWALFGITLWVWHLPGPYMAALASDRVLWLMHGTLFAGAVAAWRSVLAPTDTAMRLRGLLAAFGTSVHLAMLAGVLIFAGAPLFSYHLATTAAWGLSPLADQQLGGLIMGVVGALAYVGLNLAAAARWLMRAGSEAPSPAPAARRLPHARAG